jgi:hypothetical protein
VGTRNSPEYLHPACYGEEAAYAAGSSRDLSVSSLTWRLNVLLKAKTQASLALPLPERHLFKTLRSTA